MVVSPPDEPVAADADPSASAPPASDPVLARRAQILATEHWGLLAARGTAQSEVLTRITIYLTLVSAGLLTIGLLAQATDFRDWFAGAFLAIVGFLTLIGLMTQTRVFNVAEEDMMYVVAMNRLRGAYVDLDPAVEQYFLAAIADDEAGMQLTYSFLRRRSFSHLFGSSAVFIGVVNSCVIGLLLGGCLTLLGVGIAPAVVVGVVGGLLFLAAALAYGGWTYRTSLRNHRPLRRSPGLPGTGTPSDAAAEPVVGLPEGRRARRRAGAAES
ncbi:hypothetical protein [Microbacterium sp. 4R-513]|uniref:hypothetical protein n=1 Tax=Microbacterium sp. 4R-513 TaxID=2567934 RepID=UPI0019D2CBBB|nr:hypothetical protein [Microbacterium sp. 4R-513]